MTSTAKMARMATAQKEVLFHLRGYFPTGEFGVVIESPNTLRVALSLRERTDYNLLNHVNLHVMLADHTPVNDGRFAQPIGPILRRVERCKESLDGSLAHRVLTRSFFTTQRIDEPCHMVMSYTAGIEEVMALGITDRNMNPTPLRFAPVILACAQTRQLNGGHLFSNRLNLLLTSLYTRADWLSRQGEARL